MQEIFIFKTKIAAWMIIYVKFHDWISSILSNPLLSEESLAIAKERKRKKRLHYISLFFFGKLL